MADARLAGFVDLLHEGRRESTQRRGLIHGTVDTPSPLTVRLDGTDGPVPCAWVGWSTATPKAGDPVLVYEAGAAARYALGVVHD